MLIQHAHGNRLGQKTRNLTCSNRAISGDSSDDAQLQILSTLDRSTASNHTCMYVKHSDTESFNILVLLTKMRRI